MKHCRYAIETPSSGVYYCLHPRVHSKDNLVRDNICNICSYKDIVPATCHSKEIPIFTNKLVELCNNYHKQYIDENIKISEKRECCNNQKLPPIKEQIKNFTIATKEHIMAGLPIASSGLQEERRNICNACEYKIGNRCNKCGCVLDIKISWEEQKCPIGKW